MEQTVCLNASEVGPTPNSAAETAVKALYERLTEEQKRVVCFPWDYRESRRGLLRTFVSNHWYVTRPFIRSGFYTPEQQALIHDVFVGLINPGWYERFVRQTKDDTFGQDWGDEQSIAIFGTPGEGPFQLVMTGRHMTLRTGGGGDSRMAFGGPILYGHAAGGYYTEKFEHAGNIFWHQAQLANSLLQMCSPEQRSRALLPLPPGEADVAFQGTAHELAGIPVKELSEEQTGTLEALLDALLEPFRKEDRARVRECLRVQGGLERCSVVFYEDGRARDGTCANWRLEGPAFVWYFRGSPHLHAWVHVADTPDIPVNGRVRFVADPWPESIPVVESAPGGKLVAITTVKNEIDIVEAFVRHTLAIVNHLVILDNGSTDGTLVVLRALEREGLALTIIEDPSTGKYLSQRMTHLMRDYAVARHSADWVVPIDADEFLVVPKGESLIPQDASTHAVLSLPWRTYVPHERDDPALINPVLRLRHRLMKEGYPWVKAVVPRALAMLSEAVLTQGNHALKVGDELLPMTAAGGAYLAHFPIRGAGQYLAKIAISAFQYQTMGAQSAGGAFHWKAPYELLKRDQDLFAASISEDARRFSLPPEIAFEPETVLDPLPYRGGPILHTDRVDDRARGWSAVLSYAEDLARRYAALSAGLTPAERVALEKHLNHVMNPSQTITAEEQLLRRERVELMREKAEDRASAAAQAAAFDRERAELMRQTAEQRRRVASAIADNEALLRSRTWRAATLMLEPARLALRGLRAARQRIGWGRTLS